MPRGRLPIWTRDSALNALRASARILGRTPFVRELRDGGPSVSVFKRLFGTYRAAVKLAGLAPNGEGGRAVHGRDKRFHPEPIDPQKADALTRAKQEWWANGCSDGTWIHPYRQRRSA